MQFKHPEYLYFLGLLIIPILVHLFQLQRFTKTAFTNVALLQKLVLETRKSSQLKKWLILTTRLLLFTALILAFCQPYFSNNNKELTPHHFIYLDNSLSLNTRGAKGNIFQNTVKELIENTSNIGSYSLLTNNYFHEKLSSNELKDILLNTEITAKQSDLSDILLKIQKELKKQTKTLNKTYLISDFQQYNPKKSIDFTNVTSPISLIKTKNRQTNNLSVDSISINNQNNTTISLDILIRNQGIEKQGIPIALYNNTTVFSKQTFSIKENTTKIISFPIQNQITFDGKISLDYRDAFDFDNLYYFTLNTPLKINVFSIGKTQDFLAKIYTNNEFNFNTSSLQNINYNLLKKQELIILNELREIPSTLLDFIEKHLIQGKSLAIIPHQEIDKTSYNTFFQKLNIGQLLAHTKDSLRITDINFKSPFYKNVFSKEIKNFQYPIVKSYFQTNFNNTAPLVRFENKKNFISTFSVAKGRVYWISAPLNTKNSTFSKSPLIVPTFYNFGKLSAQLPQPSYTIGNRNLIDIPISLNKNEVVTIKNKASSFIPLQQAYKSKVQLETFEQPKSNGFYQVIQNNKNSYGLAFNYDSSESMLQFRDMKALIKGNSQLSYSESVANALQEFEQKNKVTWLWKWFLAAAIVSLIFEILILKFFKP